MRTLWASHLEIGGNVAHDVCGSCEHHAFLKAASCSSINAKASLYAVRKAGSVRGAFGPDTRYFGIDLVPGNGVDLIADATTYRPPWPVDTVICNTLLEHTPYPDLVVFNAWQCLEPGGLLILVAPCDPWPEHGADGGPLKPGEHYANITEEQLRDWASMFEDVQIERSGDSLLLMVGVK